LLLNAVKFIGSGDKRAAESFVGDASRMLLKPDGTIDPTRAGHSLVSTCFGSDPPGDDEENSLDAMLEEMAHGQRAGLIGQSMLLVGFLFVVHRFPVTIYTYSWSRP
jgi:hypothetical protein